MKLFLKLLIVGTILLVTTNSSFAENEKTVNVLTWWGYLDYPKAAKLIKDKCGATLTHDDYTSNDDMMRRWHTQSKKYDLLIFSETIYNVIKDQIILKNSDLSKNSIDYNLTIRKRYIEGKLPSNIVYFAHSLTGFIWNSKVIQLTENDTVESAFKKAKYNKVILLDDPVEINRLLSVGIKNNFSSSGNFISLANLKKLAKNTRIFISNEINQIYSQNDFAFSYQWSGDAFSRHLNIKTYKFLINKNLSYVSTDMLAQVKDNSMAACAANILAGKEFLSDLQNQSYYFSPYGNIDTVPEGEFKEAYKKFLKNLPALHWLEPPSSNQMKKLNAEWNVVKYEISKDRE